MRLSRLLQCRVRLVAACGLSLGMLAAQARGQGTAGLQPSLPAATTSSQFMGSFSSSVTLIPARESLVLQADEARIRLGPLKLRPRLYLGNVGYTNNIFGETVEEREGDVTATVGAGVIGIASVGTAVFLRGSVIPTYTWYAQNEERRGFGGTYDVSAFVYVSRFSFQFTGGSYTSTVNLSSEVEQPVEQSVLQGRFLGQWEIGRRTALTGDVTLARRRYGGAGLSQEDLDTLAGLDGTDKIWSVGVRRKVGSRLLLGVSYERGDLTSLNEGALRDATSQGILGSAYLDEGRLRLDVYGGYRDFQPKPGSTFVPYSGPSGGARAFYALSRLFDVSVFAMNHLVASLYAGNATYTERRVGVSLDVKLRRIGLRGTYETGSNQYQAETLLPDGVAVKRNDDVQTVRGDLNVPLWKYLVLRVNASQSDYASNVPGQDRSVFQIGTTLGIGAQGSFEVFK